MEQLLKKKIIVNLYQESMPFIIPFSCLPWSRELALGSVCALGAVFSVVQGRMAGIILMENGWQ